VIGKVMRGGDAGGLLRYLYGPGRANEHVDPHLVASWDDNPAALEPVLTGARHDVRRLTDLLNQPLAASARHPNQPVWHCAVRVAPTDRRLTDAEWRDVARDIVARTGLAPDGDDGACRWVAVRHADDHIHIVVTLARQDGAAVRLSNDFYRVGEACRDAEARLGLARTAPRDRTAARRATRAETEKATRAGRREPARVTIARDVRTAVAGAATADEFLTRLTDAGLLVRPRFSVTDPDVVTGYSVALPGDRTRDGRPVWFGGGKLAPDLSWPKLATRWRDTTEAPHATRLTGAEREAAWRDAIRVTSAATEQVRDLAATDPDAASDIAHATGRLLSATARLVEGRHGGPLTDAADAFDRASRQLHGRIPPRTGTGGSMRAAARLLTLAGRASRDETTQVMALVAALTALSDAVAVLRDAQQRAAQAAAARDVVRHLQRLDGPPPPTRVAAAPIHRSRTVASIHRSSPSPATNRRPQRKVQP
jgi:hypothetical protein